MNSSSSSDSSSSSSSSDSDSDASGSVATTSKRVKRMFKHKKRRKSSASTSTTATNSNLPSVISSPSTEKPNADYFKDPSRPVSRRGSTLAAIASGDEGDNEDGRTRTFDWAERHNSNETSKSPEPPKRHHKTRKAKKREKERKRRQKQEDAADRAAAEANGAPFAQTDGPKVAFSEDVQTQEIQAQNASPSKLPFNFRVPAIRPALSSYMSTTVFSNQQPVPPTGASPRPARSVSAERGGLRRTNSLPDRLNRQVTPSQSNNVNRPLPPYMATVRKAPTELSGVPSAADAEDEQGEPVMSRTAAVVLLLGSTALVAICAEFMVDAIPAMISNSSVSEAFIGLIILPIVGNAAEHVTAVTVAAKNKMDLAIGIAVGSSIQIALFVTPIVVLLGWILNTEMSLYFNIFETVSLFVTVFVVNFLVLDGRSNYLEGSLLIAAYVIIAVASFFYPATASQSNIGGGAGTGSA